MEMRGPDSASRSDTSPLYVFCAMITTRTKQQTAKIRFAITVRSPHCHAGLRPSFWFPFLGFMRKMNGEDCSFLANDRE